MRLGEYEILKSLGDGALGEVFLGLPMGKTDVHGKIALKKIKQSIVDDPTLLQALKLEAETCGGIDHPNVIQVYEHVEIPEGHLLVMEHLDGWPLSRILKSFHQKDLVLPIAVAVEIARQLCEGLQCIHSLSLAHGGISPKNLMVTRAGLVKLLDVGVARAQLPPSMTGLNGVYSSPLYWSPEQARGEKAEKASDQFATGLLLATLVLGRSVYGKASLNDVRKRAKKADIGQTLKHLEQRAPELSPILKMALSLDPKDRYTDLAQMSRALKMAYLKLPKGPPLALIIRGLMDDNGIVEKYGEERNKPGKKATMLVAPSTPVPSAETQIRPTKPTPMAPPPSASPIKVASPPPVAPNTDNARVSVASPLSVPQQSQSNWRLVALILFLIMAGVAGATYLFTDGDPPSVQAKSEKRRPIQVDVKKALTTAQAPTIAPVKLASLTTQPATPTPTLRPVASVPKKAASVPKKAASVPKKAASVPEKAAPVPKKSAPVPEKGASVPETVASIPKKAVPIPTPTFVKPTESPSKEIESKAPETEAIPAAIAVQQPEIIPDVDLKLEDAPQPVAVVMQQTARTPTPVAESGKLMLQSIPSANVLLAGKAVTNQVRNKGLNLPPGSHQLTLQTFTGEGLPPSKSVTVDVTIVAGQRASYIYAFDTAALKLLETSSF